MAQKLYMGMFFAGCALYAIIAAFMHVTSPVVDSVALEEGPNRHLLSGAVEIIPGFSGATCDASWEENSGGIPYVIISIYLFLGIAIICDGAFIDSLTMICSRYGLNLPPDVAGATFMAAGSSAPELATSFLGVFVAASPVGLGTILGSAVFNILIIIGAVAILTGEPLELDHKPVIRDNFFYAVSVVLLCVLLALDDEANLIDTIILLLWYTAYIVFLAYNDTMMGILFPEGAAEEKNPTVEAGAIGDGADVLASPTMGDASADRIIDEAGVAEAVAPDGEAAAAETGDAATSEQAAPTGFGKGGGEGEDAPKEEAPAEPTEEAPADAEGVALELQGAAPEEGAAAEGEEDEEKKRRPSYSTGAFATAEEDKEKTHCERFEEWKADEERPLDETILDVFSCPWVYLFEYTMPDCHIELEEEEEDAWAAKFDEADDATKETMKKEAWDALTTGQKWFWATFFISLIHITWISYFMVELMLKIGCLWGIPDVVMGLTFLAMGTSIPDALGSVSVAADGEGDMAVSNAVGSNVFDICMGLGLPWFIKLIIDSGATCDYIPIYKASDDVIPSIIILLAIIAVLFAVFVWGDWVLYPQSGWVLFAVYALFVIYQLLNVYVINPDALECSGDATKVAANMNKYGYEKCCPT